MYKCVAEHYLFGPILLHMKFSSLVQDGKFLRDISQNLDILESYGM